MITSNDINKTVNTTILHITTIRKVLSYNYINNYNLNHDGAIVQKHSLFTQKSVKAINKSTRKASFYTKLLTVQAGANHILIAQNTF